MQEIEFRGKRKDNGEWIIGSLIQDKWEPEKVMIAGMPILDHGCSDCGAPVLENLYWVIPETVGQWTGRLDRNGEKIFKGDIVSWDGHGIIDNGETQQAEICFDETELAYKADAGGGREWFLAEIQDDIEVIGNIYDTPELLGREGKVNHESE